MSQVTQFLTERKQKEQQWRDRVAKSDTPLQTISVVVLNPEFDLDWGHLEDGGYVVSSGDLRRAFSKNIYTQNTAWLAVLLEEVNHLLSLDQEKTIEKAFFSIDRFTYWPQGISVKEEFELMAETIRKIIAEQERGTNENS